MAGIYGTDPQMRTAAPAAPKSGRQRVADALMTMGTAFEPMQSWTQGLAKIAQGGIGGYLAGQDRQNAFNNDQSRIAQFGSAAGQGVPQPRQPFTFAAKDVFGSGQGVGRSPGGFGRLANGGASWPSF